MSTLSSSNSLSALREWRARRPTSSTSALLRCKPAVRLSAILLILSCLLATIWAFHAEVQLPTKQSITNRASQFSIPFLAPAPISDPCAGWDPLGLAFQDPPRCHRAKQFRQIQAWRQTDCPYKFDEDVRNAIDEIEKCALGITTCPPRPLILSNYGWLVGALHKATASGEAIWMGSVIAAVREEKFHIMAIQDHIAAIYAARVFSESLHMFWSQDVPAFDCISNPRCIRPEDFLQPQEAKLQHDLASIPKEELGTIPLFRIFAVTYWGSRPVPVAAPGMNSATDWNLKPEDTEWSYNPLGQQFVITPWPYPGHSWIPFSVEQECSHAPFVPFDQRNDSVLVLAKSTDIFAKTEWNGAIADSWPQIVEAMDEIKHELWATSRYEDNVPIPEGINNLGAQSRDGYASVLGHAKAMLGIYKPEISPSPYVALCRGVPLVMPYRAEEKKAPKGWGMYDQANAQHGPINTIGEPWVYTYEINDPEDMAAKLRMAVSTPITPYVPPDYSEASVRRHAKRVLYHDYEQDYRDAIEMNGGEVPGHPEFMVERCVALGRCGIDRVL